MLFVFPNPTDTGGGVDPADNLNMGIYNIWNADGNSIYSDASATLEVLSFVGVASAVNELTISNSATGDAVFISATGDDASVDIALNPKGSTGELIVLRDNNGSSGATLTLYHNTASIATNDQVGILNFKGPNSVGAESTYSRAIGYVVDSTAASLQGGFLIQATDLTVPSVSSLDLKPGQFDLIIHDSDDQTQVSAQLLSNDADGSYFSISTQKSSSNTGPLFELNYDVSAPADNSIAGQVWFTGKDSAGNFHNYAQIIGTIISDTDTAEKGAIDIRANENINIGDVEGLSGSSGIIVDNDGTSQVRIGNMWGDNDASFIVRTQKPDMFLSYNVDDGASGGLLFNAATLQNGSGDTLYSWNFQGMDSAANITSYATLSVLIGSSTSGAEFGRFDFELMYDATPTNYLSMQEGYNEFNVGVTFSSVTASGAATVIPDTSTICFVTRTATGAASIQLPPARDGLMVVVKDSGNNATANNITISTVGGDTIDDGASTTRVLSKSGQSVIFVGQGTTEWMSIGEWNS